MPRLHRFDPAGGDPFLFPQPGTVRRRGLWTARWCRSIRCPIPPFTPRGAAAGPAGDRDHAAHAGRGADEADQPLRGTGRPGRCCRAGGGRGPGFAGRRAARARSTGGRKRFGPPAATPQVLIPPPDLEAIRRDLRAASVRLRTMLGNDQWGRYLAMPADLFAPDRQPSEAEMAVVLQHYDITAQSPQYRALTDRPEFRATYDLLHRYMAARAASPRSILGMQPPPGPSR